VGTAAAVAAGVAAGLGAAAGVAATFAATGEGAGASLVSGCAAAAVDGGVRSCYCCCVSFSETVSGFDDDGNDDDDQPGICRHPGECIIMYDVANRAPKVNKRKTLIKNPNAPNSIDSRVGWPFTSRRKRRFGSTLNAIVFFPVWLSFTDQPLGSVPLKL
jgi:hypothetical protein